MPTVIQNGLKAMSCAHNTNSIIGIILAGGKSSRMGQDKALLIYQQQRMIDHMAQLLQKAKLDTIYVSGQIEGYNCIADSISNVGPAGGIYASLNYFGPSNHHYLFLPVDMPLLQPDLIIRLIKACANQSAVYFTDHYLPALLPDTPVLRHFLQGELEQTTTAHCSMKKILHAVNAQALEIKSHELLYFSNINTPLDFARLTSQNIFQEIT